MRKGEVIGSVVMNTKIGNSGDLGTWASCKRKESVEFIEQLA